MASCDVKVYFTNAYGVDCSAAQAFHRVVQNWMEDMEVRSLGGNVTRHARIEDEGELVETSNG